MKHHGIKLGLVFLTTTSGIIVAAPYTPLHKRIEQLKIAEEAQETVWKYETTEPFTPEEKPSPLSLRLAVFSTTMQKVQQKQEDEKAKKRQEREVAKQRIIGILTSPTLMRNNEKP